GGGGGGDRGEGVWPTRTGGAGGGGFNRRGCQMKKLVFSLAGAMVLGAVSALAADLRPVAPRAPPPPPSPWDIAFGGALMTDYNFRGISQSNRGSSVTAYAETRYNMTAN